MAAKYILAALGGLFLLLGALRVTSGAHGRSQGRTWLLVGCIFLGVSAWLFASR